MNVLIHTWVVSNTRGSEFAITYDYIKEMSRYHHLYVVVNSCSYKLDDLSEFSNINIENTEFIFIEPDLWLRLLRLSEKFPDPVKGWVKYSYWKAWEKRVYKKIKDKYLDKIDVIHYLGPGGNHEAGYLWMINKPYIWGPTNGFSNVPICILQHYVKHKHIFFIKNVLNTLSVYTDIRRKKAYKKADVVIAGMRCDAEFIKEKFQPKKLLYYPENTVHIYEKDIIPEKDIIDKYTEITTSDRKINVIWCGSMTPRKMPNLMLDSISRIKNKDKFLFNIIGGGELFEYVKQRSDELKKSGISINIYGQISRDSVKKIFKDAHLHLLTSASEGNPTVISEAMENCVPTIALHVCGMADTVSDKNGTSILINNYEQVTEDIARALDYFAESPDKILEKALHLRNDTFNYTLERKNEFFNSVYEYVIHNNDERNSLSSGCE